jgi:hypothetical protein
MISTSQAAITHNLGRIAGRDTGGANATASRPRVDQAVRHVHDRVDQQVRHGHEHGDALDQHVVAGADRVDEQATQPRQREQRLDHHRTAHQRGDVEPCHRQQRQRRRPQRVAHEDQTG